jgi:putative membrane protein
MSTQLYKQFSRDDIILRDHLALDRTILANERTLLAYIRTALAFMITGIGLLKFFQDKLVEVFGWIFCLFSVITIFVGFKRYRSFSVIYKVLKRSHTD